MAIIASEKARFRLRYDTDNLTASVRPFIRRMSELVELIGFKNAVIEAAEHFPLAAQYFRIEPHRLDENFGLKDEHLYSRRSIETLIVGGPAGYYTVAVDQDPDSLARIQTVLSKSTSGTSDRAHILRDLDEPERDLFNSLLENGIVVEAERPLHNFAPTGKPGIYRLQHASVLYRSRMTGILVDPHLHSTYGQGIQSDIYRDQLTGKVDAILISHFHEDHWFLSTLLMFPRDILIIVPKVPKPTIICDDMERILRSIGFHNVVAVDWYSSVIPIRDMRVHVLPFYGEQPLRFELGKHSAIRNWGNTYVVQCENYTSWFLIDSGNDVIGKMSDVAVHVRSRIGRIDFLLSNLRRFAVFDPFYINGGLNWMTLSTDQLRRFKTMRQDCLTLGPPGVAEICKIVNARYYLPYAHWFGELGCVGDSAADSPGQQEENLLAELSSNLENIGAGTAILPWKIGDGMIALTQGRFRRVTAHC